MEEFPELSDTPGINPVCPVHGNWAEVSAQELLHEYRDNQHHRGPRHDYHEHSHGERGNTSVDFMNEPSRILSDEGPKCSQRLPLEHQNFEIIEDDSR